MSYTEFYLSDTLCYDSGLGNEVWIRKIPVEAQKSSGRPILGSVVKKVRHFAESRYPQPWQLSKTCLILNGIKDVRDSRPDLGIPADLELIDVDTIPGVLIRMDEDSGLKIEGSVALPNTPIEVDLKINWERAQSMEISFGEGSSVEYIRTSWLNALSRYYKGDAGKAFPTALCNVADNYIVDMIVIAKNYAVEYTLKDDFDASIDVQIKAAQAKIGVKGEIVRTSKNSLKVTVTDGKDYLVGLKTIKWDDLDPTPLPSLAKASLV